MIIDNETLNTLIRKGDGYKTFSCCPKIWGIIKDDGDLQQEADTVPFLDGIRALLHAAQHLRPSQVHPADLTTVTFDKGDLEKMVLTLIRQMPVLGELFTAPTPNPKKLVATEVGIAVNAHKVADEILSVVEKHKENETVFSYDDFAKLLAKSKNHDLTLDLLFDANPHNPSWVSSDGPLPALTTLMPEALPAKKKVSITCKITDLNSKTGIVKVEIVAFQDKYSEDSLAHHLSDLEMHFDNQSIQLDDLRFLYYRDMSFMVATDATCATHPKHARRTVLRLQEIKLNRPAMDDLHLAAKQFNFNF